MTTGVPRSRQTIGPWVGVDVQANLTASQLLIANVGPTGYTIPRGANLRSLSVSLSGNAAGGDLSAQIYRNGAAVTGTVVIVTAGTSKGSLNFDLAGTAANDTLDVRITTPAGWSSTTVEVACFIEAQF